MSARKSFSALVAVASVLMAQASAQPGFRVAPGYPTGVNAYSIAVEDYNGDGILDMAVVNYNNGAANATVSVLLGNGDGTFQPATQFTTGLGPRFIAAGDFNNDGKWDLVTANELANSVSVLLGNGDGTFQSPISTTVGSHPWNVQVGFFNSDNNLDLVAANNTDNTIDVLLGNGNGTFSTPIPYTTGSGPIFTRVADLNGDGIADLAVANFNANSTSSNNVSLFFGTGNGTFISAGALNTSSNAAVSIVAEDLNDDGITDLAVASELGIGATNAPIGDFTVFLGTGGGSFAPGVNYIVGLGSHPRSIGVFDFNKDGIPDLVTADDGSDDVVYFQGNGDGTFQVPTVRYGSAYQPRYIAIADFNNDNNEDVAVANFAGNDATVLLGFGDGTFNSSLGTSSSGSPKSVVLADFNGDGKLDQAVVNSGNNTVQVNLGNGNGTFQAPLTPLQTGSGPISAAAADVNGDGAPDLMVANQGNNNVGVYLNKNDGSGTLQTALTYSAGTAPTAVAVGDFNGDGEPDLALSNSKGVAVLINTKSGSGWGTFPALTQFSAGVNPQSIAVGDFNKDGILDLVVANRGSNTISLLLGKGSAGKGNGTFGAATNISVGQSPYCVAVGDFNLDGNLDVAVANSAGNNVTVLLGKGNGTFSTPAATYAVDVTPEYVAVLDVNGDGKPDIVTANEGVADVSYLQGNGDGTFQTAVPFAVGTNPVAIAVGDMNNDGALDLMVANLNSATTVSLLNVAGTVLSTQSSANPSDSGELVTFTTTIASGLRNGGTPTGTITFEDGTTPIGQSNISSGMASVSTSSLSVGVHTINALYSGDSNFKANAAPSYTQTVLGSGPLVSLNPTSLAFATTLINTTAATQTITLTNTGDATLSISHISVTGTNASEFKITLGGSCAAGVNVTAGASCTIPVTFKPSLSGAASASVSITDNAPNSPQSVPLSGTGTVVKLAPASLNFGNEKVGNTSAPKPVTVTNVGSSTISFSGISIGGSDPGDFSIQASSTCNPTGTLAGGASCIEQIVFAPQAGGARTATLVFNDNGGGSPQQVALNGTGNH